jgi:putative glycerol-1-phosphate prenyltransferase
MSFEELLRHRYKSRKAQIVPLIDPENWSHLDLVDLCTEIEQLNLPFLLVGGSHLSRNDFEEIIQTIKEYTRARVILFPGSVYQLSRKADGILFLSLISGRNPEYLISKQFEAAGFVKSSELESIPTGYILVGDLPSSSTAVVTQTLPIPEDKKELILQTAITGELLGMRCIYLESGSGSDRSISTEIVELLREQINIPIIVGGGIRSISEVSRLSTSGASALIVGNILEKKEGILTDLCRSIQELQ